jgi:hypothetical protein
MSTIFRGISILENLFSMDDPAFWQAYDNWLRNGEPYDHQKDEELMTQLEEGQDPPIELSEAA